MVMVMVMVMVAFRNAFIMNVLHQGLLRDYIIYNEIA